MIILWLLIIGSEFQGGHMETGGNEAADVDWTNSSSIDPKEDLHPFLPDSMVLTIPIGNDSVVLNLVKKQNDTSEDVLIIVGDWKPSLVWKHDKDEQFSVYDDPAKSASFSLAVKAENGSVITEYYGFFVHEDIKYSLIPLKYHSEVQNKTDKISEFRLNCTNYVVYKDSDVKADTGVGQQPRCEENPSNEPSSKKRTGDKTPVDDSNPKTESASLDNNDDVSGNSSVVRSRRVKRAPRARSMNLVIDALIVVDFSMFIKWLHLNNNNRDQTIERIRYYLAHLINGVNNVYTSMQYHKLSVSVLAIYIAEKKQQSMFTEDYSVHRYHGRDQSKIDFSKALALLKKWVLEKTLGPRENPSSNRFLPYHDLAISFTNYHEDPTQGIAYLGTVCGDTSQGLVREKGQYDTITTTAHEMAHILGSRHDQDRGKCPPDAFYLMTPAMSNSRLENRDKFSRCTTEYIIDKVNQLESKNHNCLDSSKKKKRPKENLDNYLNKHPGLFFGPDEQCRIKFGREYRYCSEGVNSHETICNKMSCATGNDCFMGHPIALDGTFCGKGKWCIKGQCVKGNPSMTTNKENCFFGDKSAKFRFDGALTTCSVVQRNPKYCSDLGHWCCESCGRTNPNSNSGSRRRYR